MKKLFSATLLLFIALTAFSMQKKKAVKKPGYKYNIKSVLMHRTTCFGRCPEYTVELKANGTAIYTGIRFVPDSGKYSKNIGSTKINGIYKFMTDNHIDTCSNVYDNRIPDLPGVYYTITYKDSIKKIINAGWGPEYLKELSVKIDDIGKKTGKTWKKIK